MRLCAPHLRLLKLHIIVDFGIYVHKLLVYLQIWRFNFTFCIASALLYGIYVEQFEIYLYKSTESLSNINSSGKMIIINFIENLISNKLAYYNFPYKIENNWAI